jgi:NADPH-dependent 2,4-dienoyl-CoA reductase/sulfur reductase-like enzyme
VRAGEKTKVAADVYWSGRKGILRRGDLIVKIVIIGSGPIGVSAGFALRSRGHDVTVLVRAAGPGRRSRAVRADALLLKL